MEMEYDYPRLFAFIVAAIVSTMWVGGLAVIAIRVKGAWERLLCVVLSVPGLLVMFVTYTVLVLTVWDGLGFIGEIRISGPHSGDWRAILGYLTVAGVLVLIVAVRRVREKQQSRA
jgi:hypothetical protein